MPDDRGSIGSLPNKDLLPVSDIGWKVGTNFYRIIYFIFFFDIEYKKYPHKDWVGG